MKLLDDMTATTDTNVPTTAGAVREACQGRTDLTAAQLLAAIHRDAEDGQVLLVPRGLCEAVTKGGAA